MVSLAEIVATIPDRVLLASGILVIGSVLGLVVGRVNRRLLERAGVPGAVEGTAFERTMRGFGSSTVSVIAKLSMWFIIGVAILAALTIADIRYTQQFWASVTRFLPTLFVAILVVIVGVVVGDKIELMVAELLQDVKIPQIVVVPRVAKYSVVYIAGLIALSQIGVAVSALVVLLGAYVFGIIVVGAVAGQDLLRSGAAGMYLFLHQPYGIGDRVTIGGRSGIVQEINTFVTRLESEEEEFVIPNSQVFEHGVDRERRA